jgi:hypothetical protein
VVWLLFCFIVPPFLLLLPLVLIILTALFILSQRNDAKAKKIARSHLAGRTSDLEIIESAGTATALALNGWGVVYVSFATGSNLMKPISPQRETFFMIMLNCWNGLGARTKLRKY